VVSSRAYDPVVTEGAGKASLRTIVRAHRKTYVSGRTGRPRWQDHLTFEILPLIVAIACAWFRLKLPSAASGALIAVAAFLSVFLFTVVVSLWSRAGDLADKAPKPSAEVTRQTRDLEELAANSAYASVVCILAAGVFVVAAVTHRCLLIASTAVGLGLAVHLFIVLSMVMKRVFVQTQASLLRVNTGADRPDRSGSE
jgi:hypothetical protein